MSKVDWINWKTEPKELIDINKINENIEELYTSYNNDINSTVFEAINHEISSGGLDKSSLNIGGLSLANQYAENIIEKLTNIQNNMNKLYDNVINNCKEQRKTEKEQLIESIEERLKEEEKILNNTISLKERIKNNTSMQQEIKVDEIIKSTEEKIIDLKERLENAKNIK